jgi:hypothetical protein
MILVRLTIQNGLKQGDALSPLLLNCVLECAIRKVQENQEGLKFNGTQQLLFYAVDVNLLGDNIDTIKKTQTLIDVSKDVVLEVNTEKTMYMFLSHHRNAGQTNGLKMWHSSDFGIDYIKSNVVHEEIKRS